MIGKPLLQWNATPPGEAYLLPVDGNLLKEAIVLIKRTRSAQAYQTIEGKQASDIICLTITEKAPKIQLHNLYQTLSLTVARIVVISHFIILLHSIRCRASAGVPIRQRKDINPYIIVRTRQNLCVNFPRVENIA